MKYVIFDLETTGLVKHSIFPCKQQPRIVQIGCIAYNSKDPVTKTVTMSCTVNPEIIIPEEASAVHGITNDEAVKHSTLSKRLDELKDMFHKSDCVIGQNVQFDLNVLHANLMLHGEHTRFPFAPVVIDLFVEAKRMLGQTGKLSEIYQEVFNKPIANAHDAFADCKAVFDICVEWDILK